MPTNVTRAHKWWQQATLWEGDIPGHFAFDSGSDIEAWGPTMYKALYNIWRQAQWTERGQTQARLRILSRQALVLPLATLAVAGGTGDVIGFVAEALEMSKSTIYRDLRVIESTSFAKKSVNFPSVYKDNLPDEAAIRRKMLDVTRTCPGQGMEQCTNQVRGNRELCWGCYQHFGARGEWPPWLDYLVRDERQRVRREAIALLTTQGLPAA
jgi:hypothetical protein